MHGGKQYKRGMRHRKPNENPQEVNISEDLEFNPDFEGKKRGIPLFLVHNRSYFF